MPKTKKLRIILLSILVGFFSAQKNFLSEIVIFCAFLFLFLSIFWKNFYVGILASFLLANSYGQWRNIYDFQKDKLTNFYNQEIKITGTIVSFPDEREKTNRAFFRIKKFFFQKKKYESKEKILLIVPKKINLQYGDEIEFLGKIQKPRSFQDFDYTLYLKRFNVQSIVKNPKNINFISKNSDGNFLLRTSFLTRKFLASNLEKNLPIPHSTIAMGILLGVKNQLPEFTQNDFKNSGLQHLLVVSGSNVTIIIIFISFLFKNLGRNIVFLISIFALIFFISMTGADAPILRATIMGTLVGLAKTMGRFTDSKNLILLSAVIMGMFSPRIIQSDIGFYLSFLATLGIVLWSTPIENYLKFIPENFAIRALLAVSLAAQIAVLPILGLFFGTFPWSGILANLFAEPLVVMGMFFSFVVSVLGMLPIFLSKIISIPAFIILECLIQIAHFFGKFFIIPLSFSVSVFFCTTIFLVIFYNLFFEKK